MKKNTHIKHPEILWMVNHLKTTHTTISSDGNEKFLTDWKAFSILSNFFKISIETIRRAYLKQLKDKSYVEPSEEDIINLDREAKHFINIHNILRQDIPSKMINIGNDLRNIFQPIFNFDNLMLVALIDYYMKKEFKDSIKYHKYLNDSQVLKIKLNYIHNLIYSRTRIEDNYTPIYFNQKEINTIKKELPQIIDNLKIYLNLNLQDVKTKFSNNDVLMNYISELSDKGAKMKKQILKVKNHFQDSKLSHFIYHMMDTNEEMTILINTIKKYLRK